MYQYLKNKWPLLIVFTICVIANVGYLKNYGPDDWYWWIWMPLSVGGLILYIIMDIWKR